MKVVEIKQNIYKLGYNLDKQEPFEGIWQVPYGVSVNSYLLKGDKIALIDFIDEKEKKIDEYFLELQDIGVTLKDIDYIILNHMEPDHTGFLNKIVKENSKIKIYCSKKSEPLINNFYEIFDNIIVINDGDKLNLGKNLELQFFETPNIHWPETIMSYEINNKILFSCDAFGTYGELEDDKQFDKNLTDGEIEFFLKEGLRYFSNIVSSFSMFVKKGIEKLSALDIKIVAPSHGPIWCKNPRKIIDAYKNFAEYGTAPTNHITVIYSTMYGNTESVLEGVIEALEENKVNYSIFKIPRDNPSFILADCWKSKKIIFGMPTYEYKMFPPMAHFLDTLDRSHVKNRKVFRFGSFGWSGGAEKQFREITAKLNWEYLESVEFQGKAKKEHIEKIKEQVTKLIDEE